MTAPDLRRLPLRTRNAWANCMAYAAARNEAGRVRHQWAWLAWVAPVSPKEEARLCADWERILGT